MTTRIEFLSDTGRGCSVGATSERSPQIQKGSGSSMLSVQAFRVSRSAPSGNKSQQKISGGYGGIFCGLLRLSRRDTFWLKIPEDFYRMTRAARLREFSVRWTGSGTMFNGELSALKTLAPLTKDEGYFWLPTKLLMVWDKLGGMAGPFLGWLVYVNGDLIDIETPDGFADCFPREWIYKCPTPTATDYKTYTGTSHKGKKQTPVLRQAVTGPLAPAFLEWLMGFPDGWTDLDASATQ